MTKIKFEVIATEDQLSKLDKHLISQTGDSLYNYRPQFTNTLDGNGNLLTRCEALIEKESAIIPIIKKFIQNGNRLTD